eukprot:gnl/MRDRNA2_/MRDRNA2_91281_c0_seq1.p1 gnl/MRDRNA2_/MRDRNA2_91281_c0~~gnl/MRDRNA2_/MRDRNA2_91281_c0_seq1.p1  ORF type:complete len:268 (+),score=63.83 gnl/MRDRNA2_/MRDRNA2_91281_c0_seq1:77-805(+)
MTAPYLSLSEPLSQEGSGRYNRKALVLLALLSGFCGVALWNQLAGGEQQLSAIAMSAFAQPVKASQMQKLGARPLMPMSSRPMQSQQFLKPLRAEGVTAVEPPAFSANQWLEELETQLKDPEKIKVRFGGSTGGLSSRKAAEEESFIMTWDNPNKEVIFEMPMGGSAIMNSGPNMVRLARKEHGIALGSQLRSKYRIKDYRIFNRFPNGEIQLLHPKDGVFPEKVNAGRVGVNQIEGSILKR